MDTAGGQRRFGVGKGLIPAKVDPVNGKVLHDQKGQPLLDYDLAIPNMLLHYFPTGILGLGLTALLASFMSGMAGNVTAFNTVWTYDLYQGYINKDAPDSHYLKMGRWATVGGYCCRSRRRMRRRRSTISWTRCSWCSRL